MTESARITSLEITAALLRRYPCVRTSKFRRNLERLMPELHDIGRLGVTPDAFLIDADGRRVAVFEIEVTHPMPRAKLNYYACLRDVLGGRGVQFNLFAVSRYGHIGEVDPATAYRVDRVSRAR